MALTIFDSNRMDRYEFEVFVGKVNFSRDDDPGGKKSRKNEEPISISKYTVKMVLENLLDTEISGSKEKSEEKPEEKPEEHAIPASNCENRLKWTGSGGEEGSFADILKELDAQYVVDENPVFVGKSLCYNVAFKQQTDYAFATTKSSINKGVVCIFASLPKTLITILQRYPLELTVYEDQEDGGRAVFGTVSIMLSGPTGFTDTVAYHFYEMGYESHSGVVETVHEVVTSATDGGEVVVVGDMAVRLKLTCHGPETKPVEPVQLKPKRPALRPVSVDANDVDFPFETLAVPPSQKMTYCRRDDADGIRVLNPEIDELLRCQRQRETFYNQVRTCDDSCPLDFETKTEPDDDVFDGARRSECDEKHG